MVSQLLALLDEPTCGVACLLRPLAYFSRERPAAVQMAANTLGQIGTTARAEVRAIVQKARGQFLPPNQALGARGALRHRVAPAVPEQQYTFLAGQMAGSLAVEMHNATADDADGIVGRDHLEALRALRLGHGPSPRSGVGNSQMPQGPTPPCANPKARWKAHRDYAHSVPNASQRARRALGGSAAWNALRRVDETTKTAPTGVLPPNRTPEARS